MQNQTWRAAILAVSMAALSPTLASADDAVGSSATAPSTTDGGSDSASDLAKQLSNPIASLISVPFQLNYDTGLGSTDADRWTLNIQPVIPFDLGNGYNLISRTILPVIDLEATTPGGSSASGIGDIVQSFFFSPKEPVGGWIVGAGPVFLLPTATDDAFKSKQWGAGPTAVALRQQNGWTYGGLVNHIWGIDAPSDREKVNNTFLQPFLSYTTPDAWSYTVNSETTYNWESEEWTVPVNVMVAKLVQFGKQPVSFQAGYRHYLDAPNGGPDWGLRFAVTFLFPK